MKWQLGAVAAVLGVVCVGHVGHAFSKATARCIKQAQLTRRDCVQSAVAQCKGSFEAAFPDCFASGAGASCAMRCLTDQTTCQSVPIGARDTCVHACVAQLTVDLKACAKGDTPCADAARLADLKCSQACALTASPALQQCADAFTTCIRTCANQ